MLKAYRLALPLVFSALFTTTVYAADAEEYGKALAAFNAGIEPAGYLLTIPDRIASNLQGDWVVLSGAATASNFDEMLPKVCERMPSTFGDVSKEGFTETRGRDKQMQSRYSAWQGNWYFKTTSTEQATGYLALDNIKDEFTKQVRVNYQQGLVSIVRLSEDIMVMQQNYGTPYIYVRCP